MENDKIAIFSQNFPPKSLFLILVRGRGGADGQFFLQSRTSVLFGGEGNSGLGAITVLSEFFILTNCKRFTSVKWCLRMLGGPNISISVEKSLCQGGYR